jgi:hypothetical protein
MKLCVHSVKVKAILFHRHVIICIIPCQRVYFESRTFSLEDTVSNCGHFSSNDELTIFKLAVVVAQALSEVEIMLVNTALSVVKTGSEDGNVGSALEGAGDVLS